MHLCDASGIDTTSTLEYSTPKPVFRSAAIEHDGDPVRFAWTHGTIPDRHFSKVGSVHCDRPAVPVVYDDLPGRLPVHDLLLDPSTCLFTGYGNNPF